MEPTKDCNSLFSADTKANFLVGFKKANFRYWIEYIAHWSVLCKSEKLTKITSHCGSHDENQNGSNGLPYIRRDGGIGMFHLFCRNTCFDLSYLRHDLLESRSAKPSLTAPGPEAK